MISKTGDWKKVATLIEQMQAKLNAAEKQVLQKIGIKAEELAISRIEEQPSDWQQLSDDYASSKIKKGLSENTYIATGSYRQSITSFVVNRVAYAGLKKVARNKEGKELADIAKTLEYGSVKRNIPPRPLWQPTKQKVIQWLIDTNFVEEEFKRALFNKKSSSSKSGGGGSSSSSSGKTSSKKRIYQKGSRGGDFYVNDNGKKVYRKKK